MRIRLSLFLAALLLPPGGAYAPPAPFRDIDVGIPPGTPLEWSADLFRPPITARHGVMPPKAPPPGLPQVRERASVVQERVPEPLLLPFGQMGLYDHFRVTTLDIMRHVLLTWPRRGKYDPDVPSEELADFVWDYPPLYPTEIYWAGALNALRVILHHEVVPAREMSAYLLEMGECALISSKSLLQSGSNIPVSGPLPLEKYAIVDPEIADKRPPVAAGETPFEQAVYRLVVSELTNQFPYTIDPTYARFTLALGREAEWALVEASKSQHAFLARNAVSVLGLLPYPKAEERLREILREGKDPIQWVRAAMALGRKRDLTIGPELEKWAASDDAIFSTVSLHLLGRMADPRRLPAVLKIARETEDADTLWAALPAIARLADNTPEMYDTLKKLATKRLKLSKKHAGVGGFIPPAPEPQGTRDLVLNEVIGLARVAAGEVSDRSNFLNRVRVRGLGGFFAANQFLVIDVLRRIGPGARALLEKAMNDPKLDPSLRVAALNALRPTAPSLKTWLVRAVADPDQPPVLRTTALLALAEQDEVKPARDAALALVGAYAKAGSAAAPAEAAVVATAIQVLSGTEGGLPAKLGVDVVEKAFRDRAWGFRVTRDSSRLTKAFIYAQPPLLEIAVVELGRTRDPSAVPVLCKVLRSRAGGGRAEAALALGSFGGPEATQALLGALGDAVSGWVRFNTYRALRAISGQDHYDDWIFTPPIQLRASMRKYLDWWKTVQK